MPRDLSAGSCSSSVCSATTASIRSIGAAMMRAGWWNLRAVNSATALRAKKGESADS